MGLALSAPACARSIPPPPPDTPFEWRLPRGLPLPEVPSDNPMTTVKVALGRRLFYDKRLSGNGTFACASCHQQEHAFTDGVRVGIAPGQVTRAARCR